MNLCKADAALFFMINEILKNDCKLSHNLINSLKNRIKERRTLYSTLLNFLKNPKLKSEFDNNFDMFVLKHELKELINKFIKTNNLCNTTIMDSDSDLSITKEPSDDPNTSIMTKLNKAIDMCRSPNKINKASDDMA